MLTVDMFIAKNNCKDLTKYQFYIYCHFLWDQSTSLNMNYNFVSFL